MINYNAYREYLRDGVYQYFVTPPKLADACVEVVAKWAHNLILNNPNLFSNTIIDMGAGQGEWGAAIHKYFGNTPLLGVDNFFVGPAQEASEFYTAWLNKDFLSMTKQDVLDTCGRPASIIMGNPPYSEVVKFIRQALALSERGLVGALTPTFMLQGSRRFLRSWFTMQETGNKVVFVPDLAGHLIGVYLVVPRPHFIPDHTKTGRQFEIAFVLFSSEPSERKPVLEWLWWK